MNVSRKRYRIRNSGRFTLFIAFMLIMAVMFSNSLLGMNNASSMTEDKYISITVKAGDTLWNIASDHMAPENGDIRKAVFTLCRVNEITARELKAGQTILVPVDW